MCRGCTRTDCGPRCNPIDDGGQPKVTPSVSPRIERNRKGEFRIRLPGPERDALRALPDQLRTMLTEQPDDPSLKRLFPVAYQDDPARDEEYRRLMHDELLEQHLPADHAGDRRTA